MRNFVTTSILAGLMSVSTFAQAPSPLRDPPSPRSALVDAALYGADLETSVHMLANHVDRFAPDDDSMRFGLAMAQFLRSGERVCQSLYQYGFQPNVEMFGFFLPISRLPLPVNADPDEISHSDLLDILINWQDDLKTVEATLATIDDDDVRLRFRPGIVRFDFNNDGEATDNEMLWVPFSQLRLRFNITREGAEAFDIAMDRGDVAWLRGYCHILMGVLDMVLAHDTEQLFEHTAHIFFARPDSEFTFPTPFDQSRRNRFSDEWEIVDFATFIHLLSFEVDDAARMADAREHLLQAVAMSREMWTHYDAEVDNDREWLPRPGQTSVIPNAEITPELRETWLLFLDEAQLVLEGEHLLRFWRAVDQRGINFKRVFTEPRQFDLILWLQGSAAQPYLEEGQLTTPGTWQRLQEATNRRFFRHAFWFN
ncbi:MAG: hypothetical protein ACR2GY_04545 [Phycisphaerales bacterium]